MLSKLRRWLREGAILLVVLAGVIILRDVWRSPQMPAMFDSTPLHTLDGETVTLASISEERPVLLYFWASWCGICRFTTPDVARLQSEGESVIISVTPTLVVVSKGQVVTTTSGWTSYWGMKLRLWRAAMF